ncbi:unnamed protein product [Effrenium voratum]|nr:unnamed protein product [Effrenium voratum]
MAQKLLLLVALGQVAGTAPGFFSLKPSSVQYTEKLLGTSSEMSERMGKLLVHGKDIQVVDSHPMLLHRPPKKNWALYNPSLLALRWRDQDVFLMTYRAGTWQLCTWDGRRSPVAQLPVVKGQHQATSKVMAAIVDRDFAPIVPVHELKGQKYQEHSCTHSTGMRRVGIDDSRLILLHGEPYSLFAGVAPIGQDKPCQHRQYLCRLQLPSESTDSDLKVRCQHKVLLTFDYADKLSQRMMEQERLGSVHQKNWMPLVVGDELYLIFTIEKEKE